MKKIVICLLLIGTMLSSTSLSYAATISVESDYKGQTIECFDTSDEIAEYIEDFVGKEDLNKTIIEKESGYYAEGTGCDIIMPKDGNNYVSIQSEACDINMELPNEVRRTTEYLSENGTVIYGSKDKNVSIAVQALSDEQDGIIFDAVRTMITIENANAPKKYSFDFELPNGYSLVKDYDYEDEYDNWDCGAIYVVDEKNEVVSTIDPAWAKDAKGNNVYTYYEVKGNTLVQHVDFDANSVFPIVADPTSHPTRYTHYYTDYPTLKGIIDKGYKNCSSLGVSVAFFALGFVNGAMIATAPIGGMMLVADMWSYAQFSKVKAKFTTMNSTQWLRTTYTHTWRNGGKNSGYVRSATPELKVVAKKGA